MRKELKWTEEDEKALEEYIKAVEEGKMVVPPIYITRENLKDVLKRDD